jgi:enoyl-CoA hydratase
LKSITLPKYNSVVYHIPLTLHPSSFIFSLLPSSFSPLPSSFAPFFATLAAMNHEVTYEEQTDRAVIRIQRPSARNALNWTAQEQFATAVAQAADSAHIRALLVTADGRDAFAAGGDLKELINHPEPEAGERLQTTMGNALRQLTSLPIPVIAAVNGNAFGGGCEIMTACDLRLAVPQAQFGFIQVKVALTTGWGGAARLARLVGQSRATELLLTGRLFDAQEALQIGFLHRLAAPGQDALAAAHQWADELVRLPRQALAATKALVHAGDQPLDDQYRLERQLFVHLWPLPDHLEAMAAFVAKRPPRFAD